MVICSIFSHTPPWGTPLAFPSLAHSKGDTSRSPGRLREKTKQPLAGPASVSAIKQSRKPDCGKTDGPGTARSHPGKVGRPSTARSYPRRLRANTQANPDPLQADALQWPGPTPFRQMPSSGRVPQIPLTNTPSGRCPPVVGAPNS